MMPVMMRSFLSNLFLFACLLCAADATAQVRFSASIAPAVIGKNEYAQLKLTVENSTDVQQIVPPVLKNFTIVSGPSQESGMSMVNGHVKQYVALSYTLQPKSTGSFVIPPATARVEGTPYKSNAVSIQVVAGSTGNGQQQAATNPFTGMGIFDEPVPRAAGRDFILKKGEDPQEKIRKNMFVSLEVDRQSCYVGEPVVATYKLYTRLKSESNMVKNPSFNGFSVIDLQQPDNTNYRVESKNGKEYNVYIIRKVQLYPLLPGELELGTAEIENNVHFIKAEYINQRPDLLDGLLPDFSDGVIPPEGMEHQKVILQNKPLTITVKPLPETNKPADYKGAVGTFTIETKVEKNSFSTDDGGRMAVIISGEGNFTMVNAPEIGWPAGMEGFDAKTTEDLYKGTVPVGGRKIFEFPFTVSKAGDYTIPAISFSFFDPRQGAYRLVQSKPLAVTVTPGTGKPTDTKPGNPVKNEDSLLVSFFRSRLRVVSVVAVLIILGLIFWLRRDLKKEKKNTAEQTPVADKTPVEEIIESQQHPFGASEKLLFSEDAKTFYITLNEELKKQVAKKLSIPAESLNRRSIASRMDAMGIAHDTIIQLSDLIDAIEFQLYTPVVEEEKRQAMYTKANELVQLLNTYRHQA